MSEQFNKREKTNAKEQKEGSNKRSKIRWCAIQAQNRRAQERERNESNGDR